MGSPTEDYFLGCGVGSFSPVDNPTCFRALAAVDQERLVHAKLGKAPGLSIRCTRLDDFVYVSLNGL